VNRDSIRASRCPDLKFSIRDSRFTIVLCLLALSASVAAQDSSSDHEHHHHEAAGETTPLLRPREASGTAWVPDDTPMYGVMLHGGGWETMLHGNVFGQFVYEPGDRHRTGGNADAQWSSVNWFMAMARRPLGSGRFGLRAMFSLEPWTVTDCGVIDYLATGEMCDGDTIHDRQHPHDLLMELAADYDRPLRGSLRWQVYAGLSGEPALGPPGYPHRLSAMPNPVAPITHHWLDSTHISFGLVTTGIYSAKWKAEASVFNGREPDDHRADLDLDALDSVSGRLWWLPAPSLALQVSAAHLTEAEAQFAPSPRSDADKLTASATYHRRRADNGFWDTTLAYGLKSGTEIVAGQSSRATTSAVLFETNLTLRDRHAWFGRAEVVGKPAEELHAHEFGTQVFTVGKLEAGYARYLRSWKGLTPGFGGTVSASLLPQDLASRYDGRVAWGLGVFVTLRPARHAM